MTQLPDSQLRALVTLGLPSPSQPYPTLEQVGSKVSAIAGTGVKQIESKIDAALVTEPDLSRFLSLLQTRRSNRLNLSLAGWDNVTFYGSVVDEVLRTERNKLRLSLLSSAIPQRHLVHATVVGPWFPASVLENPDPPRATLINLSEGFCRNLRRALPELCFEHVGLVGFAELKKCFGKNADGHDVAMAGDWYLRRGGTSWGTSAPQWPQYSLHVHLIGYATRFQRYATAEEMDDAFDRLFPERWSVVVKPWIEANSVIDNVIGLGNYVWKIGPHRKHNPVTPMPLAEEIRANARFWSAVGHHRRNIDVHGQWPELGPRRIPRPFAGTLTRLDAMRRQLAWDTGLRIWTADDFEPDPPTSVDSH